MSSPLSPALAAPCRSFSHGARRSKGWERALYRAGKGGEKGSREREAEEGRESGKRVAGEKENKARMKTGGEARGEEERQGERR